MASPNPAARLIWVQKHPEAPDDRVAIYDRDPAHPATRGNPAGELYIADRFPRLVAETVSVNQKCQRSHGGPPDLIVLREDEALKIEEEMEAAEEERLATAREEAMQAQRAAGPSQNMPPEVAAWMANNGMLAMPMGGFQAPQSTPSPEHTKRAMTQADSDPNSSDAARTGRGGGDSNAERTGVSTAVEAGPVPGSGEKAGEGTKSGEQEGATTDQDESPSDQRRSHRSGR